MVVVVVEVVEVVVVVEVVESKHKLKFEESSVRVGKFCTSSLRIEKVILNVLFHFKALSGKKSLN